MWSGAINTLDLPQPEGTHLKAERIGIVQARGEKALGQLNFGSSFHEESPQEGWRKDCLQVCVVIGKEGMVLK